MLTKRKKIRTSSKSKVKKIKSQFLKKLKDSKFEIFKITFDQENPLFSKPTRAREKTTPRSSRTSSERKIEKMRKFRAKIEQGINAQKKNKEKYNEEFLMKCAMINQYMIEYYGYSSFRIQDFQKIYEELGEDFGKLVQLFLIRDEEIRR